MIIIIIVAVIYKFGVYISLLFVMVMDVDIMCSSNVLKA